MCILTDFYFRNNKCIVIYGPIGTGKTSSVYALANDLNFRVIEINAGLKRTGKKMLQELQEATQSHRIKKVQDVEDHEPENQKTVILIEDADVVFEDLDDGFVASLQTLVNVSKRPVILTALNENCSHLQKFQQGNSVFYNQPTRTNLTLYLNILCLVECHITTPDQMYQLLKINGRDLRKTINEIEFFVKSGNSRSSEDELIEFYGRGKQITKKRSWEKFELLESELAIIQLTRRKNEDRLAVCLEDEIAEFLRCSSFVDDNELLVKRLVNALISKCKSSKCILINRSLCSELYTAILCLQTKSMALDYNSSMRQICRTEKSRLAMERKGSRFYHYLRNSVCTNTFSNTFFDEFCDSFQ